jgi:hypothetical protein
MILRRIPKNVHYRYDCHTTYSLCVVSSDTNFKPFHVLYHGYIPNEFFLVHLFIKFVFSFCHVLRTPVALLLLCYEVVLLRSYRCSSRRVAIIIYLIASVYCSLINVYMCHNLLVFPLWTCMMTSAYLG